MSGFKCMNSVEVRVNCVRASISRNDLRCCGGTASRRDSAAIGYQDTKSGSQCRCLVAALVGGRIGATNCWISVKLVRGILRHIDYSHTGFSL